VQLNVGGLDENGVYNGTYTTYAMAGRVRTQVSAQACQDAEGGAFGPAPGGRRAGHRAGRGSAQGGGAGPTRALRGQTRSCRPSAVRLHVAGMGCSPSNCLLRQPKPSFVAIRRVRPTLPLTSCGGRSLLSGPSKLQLGSMRTEQV
jgi:hypothetical protein